MISMTTFNLVLSGGGVRSYAHLGVYKYCFENGIEFNEIVSVSGGAIIAPFIYLRKNPNEVIEIFKNVKIHKMLFPFWFMPDKFEFLFYQPSTIKLGEWVEKQLTTGELANLSNRSKGGVTPPLHIMATKNPLCGIKAMYTDMLQITDLKNAIAASSSISGIFKEHKVSNCTYIDGGHYYNCPIFFNFQDSFLPVIAVNLGYPGLIEENDGRISKIIKGLEISSYARVQEDIKRWEFEKNCGKRGDLFVVNPPVWNVRSLDFNLKDLQMDELISAGYKAAKAALRKEEAMVI